MKQTIRFSTFETNSSSYHSISLVGITEESFKFRIIKGQPLVLELPDGMPEMKIEHDYGYYAEYRSDYEKAVFLYQLILEHLSTKASDVLWETNPHYKDISWEEECKLKRQTITTLPLYKVYIKALSRYAETNNITIKLDNDEDCVSDSCKNNLNILGLNSADEQYLEDRIYEIISSNDWVLRDNYQGD